MSASKNPDWLLISDVDNTLFGDDRALERFTDVARIESNFTFVLNSSRPIASILKTLQTAPDGFEPAAIIGAMGTEIQVRGTDLSDWAAPKQSWSRKPFDRLMADLGFTPHDDEFQTDLKASFCVPRPQVEQVADALERQKLPARLIFSGDSDLDILPPGFGKGRASLFVTAHLGHSADRLIVSGDSANDLDMFESADRGIVVGNGSTDLRQRVDPNRTYFARKTHADGVLEGLAHWGALQQTTLESFSP